MYTAILTAVKIDNFEIIVIIVIFFFLFLFFLFLLKA